MDVDQVLPQITDILLRCEEQKLSPAAISLLFDMMVNGSLQVHKTASCSQTIVYPGASLVLLSFLPVCSLSLQLEIIMKLTHVASRSLRNAESLREVGVLPVLISLLPKMLREEVLAGKVLKLIVLMAQHSISVSEFKSLIQVIKISVEEKDVKNVSKVLTSIQEICSRGGGGPGGGPGGGGGGGGGSGPGGPSSFFDLNGSSNCGIALPQFKISSNGYTFCIWLRLEKEEFLVQRNQKQPPRILSMLNKDGEGIILNITPVVVFATLYSGSTPNEQAFKFNFEEGKWYFLSFVHIYRFGRSEMKMFVNGEFVSRVSLSYPANTKLMQHSSIGADSSAPFFRITEQPSFIGQIGPVFLLDHKQADNKISQLYQVNPDVPQEFLKVINRDELNWIYHPMAFEKNCVYDLTGKNHGVIVGSLKPILTQSIKDAFYCSGSIKIIYPLFHHLDHLCRSVSQDKKEFNLVSQLITLITRLLQYSPDNQRATVEESSIEMLGFLLQQCSPQHLEGSVIPALLQLLETCSEVDSLMDDVVLHLLLNFRLWSRTNATLQRTFLMGPFMKLISGNTQYYRQIFDVQKILDVMQKFYSFKFAVEETKDTTTGSVLNLHQIAELRSIFINAIAVMLHENSTLKEVSCLIQFIQDCEDPREVSDVLHLLLRMLCKEPKEGSTLILLLEELGGTSLFLNFLSSDNERVRVLCLKIIGKLCGFNKAQRQKQMRKLVTGWILPTTESSSKAGPLLYAATIEILFDRITPSTDGSLDNCFLNDPKSTLDIVYPSLLSLVFVLVLKVEVDSQLKLKMIQDFMILFSHAKAYKEDDEKTPIDVRILFLEQKGWQKCLFDIIYQVQQEAQITKNHAGAEVVTEMVMSLFNPFTHYSLVNIDNGWRIFPETEMILLNYPAALLNPSVIMRKLYMSAVDHILNNMNRFKTDELLCKSRIAPAVAHLVMLVEAFAFLPTLQEQESKLTDPKAISDLNRYMHRSDTELLEIQVIGDDPPDLNEFGNQQQLQQQQQQQKLIGKWEDYELCTLVVSLVEYFLKPPFRDFFTAVPTTLYFGRDSYSVHVSVLRIMLVLLQETEFMLNDRKLTNRISDLDGLESTLIGMRSDMFQTESNKLKLSLYLAMKKKETTANLEASLKTFEDLVNRMALLLPAVQAVNNNASPYRLYSTITLTIVNALLRFCWRSLRKGSNSHLSIISPFRTILRSNLDDNLATCTGEDPSKNFFVENVEAFADDQPKEVFVRFILQCSKQYHVLISLSQNGTISMDQICQKAVYPLCRKRSDILQEFKQILLNQSKETEKIIQQLTIESSALTQKYSSKEVQRRLFQSYSEGKMQQNLQRRWKLIWRELTHQYAVWGVSDEDSIITPSPETLSSNISDEDIIFWKLSKQELGHRMRRKLKRNYAGTQHRNATFAYWKEKYKESEKQRQESIRMKRQELQRSEARLKEKMKNKVHQVLPTPRPLNSDFDSEEIIDGMFTASVAEEFDLIESSSTSQQLSLTPPNLSEEKVIFESSCTLVCTEISIPGRLEVHQNKILFYHDRSITSDMGTGAEDENSLPDTNYDALVKRKFRSKLKDREWAISNIVAIYSRRYLLNWTALEIFFIDCRNYFFNLPAGQSEVLFKALVSLKLPNLQFSFCGHGRTLFNKKQEWTEKWKRREISNFDYLMILNTMAGRTYNDLTQYPVFPWILSNYTSPTLDLTDPNNYRDLSKPIGALEPDRALKFKERFDTFKDEVIPPFHYGSHYLAAGSVLFYLMRMEPFTTQLVCLQGGKFDFPDRLFHSVSETWDNCLRSTTDVKELIPEFFYLPEFLKNSNGFDFGKRHTGQSIHHVELPPWANTPEEFVNIHMQALESEYVSNNLHHWIDLVFGYKQNGDEAVKAMNCFYYLTYEGAVDLDTLSDPVLFEAMKTQIENFGQTPAQLLKTPHPRRNPPITNSLYSLMSPRTMQVYNETIHSNQQLPFCTSYNIYAFSRRFVTINSFGEYLIHNYRFAEEQKALIDKGEKILPFIFDLDKDFSMDSSVVHLLISSLTDAKPMKLLCGLKTLNTSNRRLNTYSFPDQNEIIMTYPKSCVVVEEIESSRTSAELRVIYCGNWENTFEVAYLDGFQHGLKVVQPVITKAFHKRRVTCLHVDGMWLACGSEDGMVSVWACRDTEARFSPWPTFLRSNPDLKTLVGSPVFSNMKIPSSDFKLSEKPVHILHCHYSMVTCISVSTQLDIVVSGEVDGLLVIHNLFHGTCLRTINFLGSSLDKLLINHQNANLIFYCNTKKTIYVYSINGDLLAFQNLQAEVDQNIPLLYELSAMVLTQNGSHLITAGGTRVCVREAHNLEVVRELQHTTSNVCDMALDPEERILFVAQIDGRLGIYCKSSGTKLL